MGLANFTVRTEGIANMCTHEALLDLLDYRQLIYQVCRLQNSRLTIEVAAVHSFWADNLA
jgi:hypothetical protein